MTPLDYATATQHTLNIRLNYKGEAGGITQALTVDVQDENDPHTITNLPFRRQIDVQASGAAGTLVCIYLYYILIANNNQHIYLSGTQTAVGGV